MRRFKKIDFQVSILLISVFVVLTCIRMDYVFIVGYCVVGGWQLISMIVHATNHWFTEKYSVRFYYHRLVLGIFILSALGMAIPYIVFFMMYLMLIAAPIMAVYYTVLCYEEAYVKMRRPLSALKN